MQTRFWLTCCCLLLAGPLAGSPSPAETQAEPPSTREAFLYRFHCASCHGKSGEGDGPMARYLTVPPADLTLIRARRDGEFPAEELFEIIDGRSVTPGHGSREMPVWGISLQEAGRESDQEEEVGERIRMLVDYLHSIQAEAPEE